jgi:hypothetical protein
MIWISCLSLQPTGTHQVHKLYALLCFIAGGSLAWVGWKILRPYDRPPQATGFSGPTFSRHLFIGLAGNVLLILGIVIAVLFTLILLLT